VCACGPVREHPSTEEAIEMGTEFVGRTGTDDRVGPRADVLTRRQLLHGLVVGAGTVGVGMLAPSVAAAVERRLLVPGPGLGEGRPWPSSTEHTADVAHAWFELALGLVKHTPGFSPPVASRAFAYLGVGLYETVVAGAPSYRSLAGQLHGLSALPQVRDGVYDWSAAANAGLAAIARRLWSNAPEEQGWAIDRLERRWRELLAPGLPPGVVQRSQRWGRQIASAVHDWARHDGGHDAALDGSLPSYVPPTGPGMWEPTPPAYLPALQPSWGENRCFVLPTSGSCPADTPTPFDPAAGSDFHREALEVRDAVENLAPEQREIARFWADDPGVTATPPGHVISITTQVARADGRDLMAAAEGYAKVGLAVADAFIACWRTKYEVNLLRPVSYLQRYVDPTWGSASRPLPVTTPPFPEYPSGHSVQSAAAAEVLTAMFGEGRRFVDHTHDRLGFAPRSFTSFEHAAQEAAISRLYGGIHFRPAIEHGLVQGRCVGRAVNALATTR
jgi:hypothetical protein